MTQRSQRLPPGFVVIHGFAILGRDRGEVFAMWVGLKANVPVVNGYSGRVPGGDIYPGYGVVVTDDMLRKWFDGRFHGKVAIVDPENLNATRVVVIE